MGQTATIAIVIDQNIIVPGSEITGKVYLDVKQERIDGESLVIRLVGSEHTCAKWTTTTQRNNKSHTVRHSSHSHCVFLDLPFSLSTMSQGYFSRGQYEFPFSFILPFGINPCMEATLPGEHGGFCNITYRMEARLHRKGWFKWDVSNTAYFWVTGQSELSIPQCPAYIPPQQQDVRFCYFLNRGNITFGLHTPNSFLKPGEPFDISYIVQNNSHATVKAIELAVLETVIWHSGGRQRSLVVPLFTRRLERETLQLDLTPLKVKERLAREENQQSASSVTTPARKVERMGNFIVDHNMLQELKSILDKKSYFVSGNINPNARISLTGTLIQVNHLLQMKIVTTFGTNNPLVSFPITIHRHGMMIPSYNNALPAIETSQVSPVTVREVGIVNYEENEDGYDHSDRNISPSAAVVAVPKELPSDWSPVIAHPVVIPAAVYATPVLSEGSEQIPQNFYTPSAPVMNYDGFSSLQSVLKHTFYPVGEFQTWLTYNSADSLTAEQLQVLFSMIPNVIDQLTVLELLVTSRSFFNMNHIISVLQSCSSMIKTEIVQKMSGKCVDKNRKDLLKNYLTAFEYICIEHCFNE
jgi:hypothetical protein